MRPAIRTKRNHGAVLASGFGLACLIVVPTACSTDSAIQQVDSRHGTSQSELVALSTPESDDQGLTTGENDNLQAMVDVARRAAARESGVDQGEIETINVTEMVWPNAALGCPQPDRMYAQVLVPGARVNLRIGEMSYHYHCGEGYEPVLCASSARVEPEPHPLMPAER